MKAWVLYDINDIRYEDKDIPLLKKNEVLLRVKAAGVCGSDIPRIYKTGAHKMPLVPGHEFSGIVEDIGEDVSKEWLNKRVGVYPLIPCGECIACKNAHPEMCRNYDYIGSRRDGAFAEYVSVPVNNLIEIPENISFEEAAMLEPMAVAVHAMGQAVNMTSYDDKNKSVIVCGLGTIGLLVTMFLKERGYENIYVIGNKEYQKEKAASLGIPEENFINSKNGNVTEHIKKCVGSPDIFFECVGKNECLNYGIESSGPGTKIILLGNPASDMTLNRDTYWKILRNQLTIKGTWNSTFFPNPLPNGQTDDWRHVINTLNKAKEEADNPLKPESLITHRFALSELQKGLNIMKNKTENHVKIMITRSVDFKIQN